MKGFTNLRHLDLRFRIAQRSLSLLEIIEGCSFQLLSLEYDNETDGHELDEVFNLQPQIRHLDIRRYRYGSSIPFLSPSVLRHLRSLDVPNPLARVLVPHRHVTRLHWRDGYNISFTQFGSLAHSKVLTRCAFYPIFPL